MLTLALTVLLPSLPARLSAQAAAASPATGAAATNGPVVSISAGAMQFDLSGTGWTGTTAVRAERSLVARWLLGEIGLSALRPREEDWRGAPQTYLVPEVLIQVQRPSGRVRPFLGAGVGWFHEVAGPGPRYSEPTFAAAVGSRLALRGRLGARVELRVRGIGTNFAGTTAEWTSGLSWGF